MTFVNFLKQRIIREMDASGAGIGGAVASIPVGNIDSYAPGDARIATGNRRLIKRKLRKRNKRVK